MKSKPLHITQVVLSVHCPSIIPSSPPRLGYSPSRCRWSLSALHAKCGLPFLNILFHQFTVVMLGRVGHPLIAQMIGIKVVLMTNFLD
jgi:hypothetical protein